MQAGEAELKFTSLHTEHSGLFQIPLGHEGNFRLRWNPFYRERQGPALSLSASQMLDTGRLNQRSLQLQF